MKIKEQTEMDCLLLWGFSPGDQTQLSLSLARNPLRLFHTVQAGLDEFIK